MKFDFLATFLVPLGCEVQGAIPQEKSNQTISAQPAMIQRSWRASESRIQILPLQDSLTYARKVNFNHNGMLRNIIFLW